MAPTAGQVDTTETDSSTEDTSGQEQQDQQQATTDDTSGNGDQQQESTVTKDTKLPEDHPVVKQMKADKDKLTAARAEIAELRTKSAQVTKLEEELAARPTAEALETLQTRYDRLEAFLGAVGGPLSKALDSRTFTRDLFETETPVPDLVKAFLRNNPTATSAALGAAAGQPAKPKSNMNDAIRAAVGK